MPPGNVQKVNENWQSISENVDDNNDFTIIDSIPKEILQNFPQEAGDAGYFELQLVAVKKIRNMFTSESPSTINLNEELPFLVECLKQKSHKELQLEAAWALTNIASGDTEQTTQVVAAGAVPQLLELLKSPDLDVREQAIWALANIIGDGPLLRDFVIKLGIVPILTGFVHPDTPTDFLGHVTLAIVNLFRHYEPQLSGKVIQEILPHLHVLISHKNVDILKCSLWAITFLAGGGQEYIQMLIESGFLGQLIALMGHEEVQVQNAAMQAMANILAGTDDQCQAVLNNDPLPYFPSAIFYFEDKILEGNVKLLWRATSRNQAWVQAFINVGLLGKIIRILKSGMFHEKAVAARAISNLTIRCNREQLLTFLREDGLAPFCELLTCQFEQVTFAVLNGLENMLKKVECQGILVKSIIDCGGLAKIAELQTHENVEVYKLSHRIIEQYFSGYFES
ncbi:importin subunit alpha-3-like [Drosophila ficusphila]|uniref:importin subunit alpha-3-like n=1 Tax=Drosophila ficusphila TaxID=30025 RepID=UPI0007E668C9|nr:importin subunit alpha-3-like [Drosophila ficusphila]